MIGVKARNDHKCHVTGVRWYTATSRVIVPTFWSYTRIFKNILFKGSYLRVWLQIHFKNCLYRLNMGFKSSKIAILVKNPNLGQKAKFWSKIEILVKHADFVQKSKFWSKIQILVKNPNFVQKSKFWSNMQILVINPNFGQKSKFWSKILIFAKIWILVNNRKIGRIFATSNIIIRRFSVFVIVGKRDLHSLNLCCLAQRLSGHWTKQT